MPRTNEDWPRLASYVVSARIAAGFKDRRALSAATGVTDRTLGKLETGNRVSPDTLAAIEIAVGWRPDSARTVLNGGEPVMQRAADPEDDPLTPAERAAARAFIQAIREGRAGIEREEEGRGRNGKDVSA
jgi:transcriptional regulator with XRE-family HTH domain